MLLLFSTSFCLICGCDNWCNSKPDELRSNQALQLTAGRLRKFLDDSFNFKILSTARYRQRWLSLVSLGLSLLRNRGLAAKDILLDIAGGCFRQLGHKLDSLGTLEVRQMITSVIAQLGFRRGRACF